MRRTDKEIKEWIDSKDVLTRRELTMFMQPGRKTRGNETNVRFCKWWDYVLKTKDWNKLKEYAADKVKSNLNKERFEEFVKLYKSDIRIREYGKVRGSKYLKKKYNLELHPTTLKRYKEYVQQETIKTVF